MIYGKNQQQLDALLGKLNRTFEAVEYGNWPDGAPEWYVWERRLNRIEFMKDQINKAIDAMKPALYMGRLNEIEQLFNSVRSRAEYNYAVSMLHNLSNEMSGSEHTDAEFDKLQHLYDIAISMAK